MYRTAICLPQLPQLEEIEALLSGRMLNTIAFFLDETFEELAYDVTSTVLEAVEQLAALIKLQNYSTFTLFECRKAVGAKMVRRGRAGVCAPERVGGRGGGAWYA